VGKKTLLSHKISKMRKLIFSMILISSVILPACKPETSVYSNITGFIQGSTYSIVYENKKNLDPGELRVKIEKILHDFDLSLSLYNDSSVLSKINRNEDVTVDSFFTEAFRKSVIISEMTDGAFDITVGPLVRAWGFGPDAHKNFTESKRDSLLKLTGMKNVTLVDGRVIKTDPHVMLDFNAMAQGYSVDIICRYFDELDIRNYLVEIGGEVRVKGKKNGNLWRIGIDRPEDNNFSPGQKLEAIVQITDKALATSGNYRKFYIEDGVKYSHHIDPKTGYTVKNNVLSVSVFAGECAVADGIGTAFLVMGKEKIIEFLGLHPEFEAYIIYSDESGNFKTWTSEKLKKLISETEEEN
jgi:thiamine biosynthesis lipoprotein